MEEREVSGWVWPSNVQRLLSWASHYIGYTFDDSDWQAVETALPATDDEREDGWFEYPLVGAPSLRVRLARAVEAAPVSIHVAGDMDDVLAARIETLLDLLAALQRSVDMPVILTLESARRWDGSWLLRGTGFHVLRSVCSACPPTV